MKGKGKKKLRARQDKIKEGTKQNKRQEYKDRNEGERGMKSIR